MVTVEIVPETDSTPFGRVVAQCLNGRHRALSSGDHYVLDLTRAAGELVLDLQSVGQEFDDPTLGKW